MKLIAASTNRKWGWGHRGFLWLRSNPGWCQTSPSLQRAPHWLLREVNAARTTWQQQSAQKMRSSPLRARTAQGTELWALATGQACFWAARVSARFELVPMDRDGTWERDLTGHLHVHAVLNTRTSGLLAISKCIFAFTYGPLESPDMGRFFSVVDARATWREIRSVKHIDNNDQCIFAWSRLLDAV